MKHTIEELQFAATVMDRALALRNAARQESMREYAAKLPALPESPAIAYNEAQQREQDLAAKAQQLRRSEQNIAARNWEESNPAIGFVQQVLAELGTFAQAIKDNC